MKIMVFDVPADGGGALTILNQYYDIAVKDSDIEWIFVISTPKLSEQDNVKVLNFPWVRKSWFHRLFFDIFTAHKLVEKYQVDKVLSLQNIVVWNVDVEQVLYLHQSLPFVEKRYGITEDFKFWVYQNIIGRMIFSSVKKADKVIVQTNWMIEAAIQKTKVKREKFILKQPKLNVKVNKLYEKNKGSRLFFYPANGFSYKNHDVIVKACMELKNKGIEDYRVVLTLNGDENNYTKKLHEVVLKENLHFEFIGTIDINQVYEYYSKSILVFPSYIETFGLPLLEARMHEAPILASDCAFSHEVLDDYEKVNFFDPFNHKQLSEFMEKSI